MSLSKTAKRFLSSTMAIALAGGSVLAFGNSALAGAGSDPASVKFESAVSPECAIEVASDVTEYDVAATADIAGDDRTTELTATDSIGFDCNSDTVSIRVSRATSSYNGGEPITNAKKLTASHAWEWGTGAEATSDFFPSDGAADLDLTAATDANGDVEVSIKSTWKADEGAEELLAATYTSSLSLDVTAN